MCGMYMFSRDWEGVRGQPGGGESERGYQRDAQRAVRRTIDRNVSTGKSGMTDTVTYVCEITGSQFARTGQYMWGGGI